MASNKSSYRNYQQYELDDESGDDFLSPPPNPDTSWIGARLSPIGSFESDEEDPLLSSAKNANNQAARDIQKRRRKKMCYIPSYLPWIVMVTGTLHLLAITVYDITVNRHQNGEQSYYFLTSFLSVSALERGGALNPHSWPSILTSLTLCISWYDLLVVVLVWSTLLSKSRFHAQLFTSPNILWYALAHNLYAFLLEIPVVSQSSYFLQYPSGALLAATVACLVAKAYQRPTHRYWLLVLFVGPLYLYHFITPFHSIVGISGACLAALASEIHKSLIIVVLALPLIIAID